MPLAKINWYYAAQGSGQVSDIVAHSRPAVDAIRVAANQMGERAADHLELRAFRRSGDAHIEVEHMGGAGGSQLDSYVKLVDEDGGAGAIEFGWSQINKDGDEYGHDGLAVLRDAMAEAVARARVR